MNSVITNKLHDAGIRMTATMTNGPLPEWAGQGSHSWSVTLRYKGCQFTLPFYTGSMCGEVTAADVLSCLALDAGSTNQSFESWCADLGYDSDSRRAEATYKACQRNAVRLTRLLGNDLDVIAEIVRDY